MLRLLAFFLLAASVALTAAQQLVSDGPWWLELSRYLPWPAPMLAPALALLLSLRLGGRWVAASVVTIALVATIAMDLAWHEHPDGPRPGTLRLMTWNVKAPAAELRPGGIDELAQEVARHRPDILVMQEAQQLLRARAPGAKPPLFGLPEVHVGGQYIVASRLPLRDCAEGRAPVGGEQLSFMRCTVDAEGQAVQLVTVHFGSPRSGLNAAWEGGFDGVEQWQRNHEARLAQARALAAALAPGGRPLIVAGDLNAPESSPVIGSLLAIGLRDAFSNAGRGYGYTYGHSQFRLAFSFLRIDHILVSAGIAVVDSFVGGAEASDHRPVVADLVLGAAGGR